MGLAEFVTVESQNLTVIGHVDDLLCCIYANACNNILPFICMICSMIPVTLFNHCGWSVHLMRPRCSIPNGIFTTVRFFFFQSPLKIITGMLLKRKRNIFDKLLKKMPNIPPIYCMIK